MSNQWNCVCVVPGAITFFMGIYRVICLIIVLSFNSFGGLDVSVSWMFLAELQLSGHHD